MDNSKSSIKQIQKAGSGSDQYQIGSLVINGISEERTRAIFSEMFALERANYTQEALVIVQKRVDKLEESLIPRIQNIEGASAAFADPKFQFLMRDAQKAAASTDRLSDYDLLSELLVCHIQKGENRKNRAGIDRAISIVDEIDNDALCGLTVFFAVGQYSPVTGNIQEGIMVLDRLFNQILDQALPKGNDWIDHLDLLGTIRYLQIGSLKKLLDIYARMLNGYVCCGIKKDSAEYVQAIELLKKIHMGESGLVPHELLDGYVRLPFRNKDAINTMSRIIDNNVVPLSDEDIKIVDDIWALYSKDVNLLNTVKNNFKTMWDSFDSLKTIREWWDNIEGGISITHVGRVLAHTNAKRCNPDLPDLLS